MEIVSICPAPNGHLNYYYLAPDSNSLSPKTNSLSVLILSCKSGEGRSRRKQKESNNMRRKSRET